MRAVVDRSFIARRPMIDTNLINFGWPVTISYFGRLSETEKTGISVEAILADVMQI